MDRLKENEIYDKFQDLCNSHKEISHFGDKHICNTECPLRDTNRCENVFFYQQGKADALDIDEDSVRFTNEQKAWVKKYIIRQNKARYELGAREFAEWLLKHPLLNGFDEEYFYTIRDCQMTIDEVLAEWQKEVNNAE